MINTDKFSEAVLILCFLDLDVVFFHVVVVLESSEIFGKVTW